MQETTTHFPFGPGALSVRASEAAITSISFHADAVEEMLPDHPLLSRAHAQLVEYARGERNIFDLPLLFPTDATAFQQKIWRALLTIPYGTAYTYGELASCVGTSARAVGGALRANPLPIVVPCHRVVARDGLGGFSGRRHVPFKEFLLDLEGVAIVRTEPRS